MATDRAPDIYVPLLMTKGHGYPLWLRIRFQPFLPIIFAVEHKLVILDILPMMADSRISSMCARMPVILSI